MYDRVKGQDGLRGGRKQIMEKPDQAKNWAESGNLEIFTESGQSG